MNIDQEEITNKMKLYFDEYVNLFLNDLAAFNTHYTIPTLNIRDDGSFYVFNSPEESLSFFEEALLKYSTEGCEKWLISNLKVDSLGAISVLVTVDWLMLRKDNSPIRGWRQSYNLYKSTTGWKIALSTVHSGTNVEY